MDNVKGWKCVSLGFEGEREEGIIILNPSVTVIGEDVRCSENRSTYTHTHYNSEIKFISKLKIS